MIGNGERLFAFVFGLFLVGVGAYTLLPGQASETWRIAGGATLIVLGGNMLRASWRGKPSWLSRIGPLP